MKGQLGPPEGRKYKEKSSNALHCAKQIADNQLRELYAKRQIDNKHPEKFQASFDRLSKDMQDEVMARRKAAETASGKPGAVHSAPCPRLIGVTKGAATFGSLTKRCLTTPRSIFV